MKLRYLVIGILLTSCYVSDVLPEDQATWSYGKPKDFGFDESKLLTIDSLLDHTPSYGFVNSLLIIQNGTIMFENYYDESFRDRQRPIDIATYGYTVAFLDFFLQRGLIGNLDEPIYTFLPEYEDIFDKDETKKQITFRHLLDQKSGLGWNQFALANYYPRSDFTIMRTTSEDWCRFILSKDLSPDPGLQLAVNSGAGIILCKIYQNLLGGEDLREFLKENYFDPLNIKEYTWATDSVGNLDGATGLSLSSFDHAKMGMLIANGGRTNQKQRIISEEWMFEMTKVQNEYIDEYDLGYGWNVYGFGDFSSAFGLEGFVELRGDLGQILMVNPTSGLIVSVGAENVGQDYFYNPSMFLVLRVLASRSGSSPN